jgi:hypothetical protein
MYTPEYVAAYRQLAAIVEQQSISSIVTLLAEVCYSRARQSAELHEADQWEQWAIDLDAVVCEPVEQPA